MASGPVQSAAASERRRAAVPTGSCSRALARSEENRAAIIIGLGQRPVPVLLAAAKIALVAKPVRPLQHPAPVKLALQHAALADARAGAEDQTPFARDL